MQFEIKGLEKSSPFLFNNKNNLDPTAVNDEATIYQSLLDIKVKSPLQIFLRFELNII